MVRGSGRYRATATLCSWPAATAKEAALQQCGHMSMTTVGRERVCGVQLHGFVRAAVSFDRLV